MLQRAARVKKGLVSDVDCLYKVLRFVSGLLKDLKYFSVQVAIFARFAHDVMAAMLEEFKQKNLINSCCITSFSSNMAAEFFVV